MSSPTARTPRVFLAPMEGVVDAAVRDLWTRIGGYDLCFTEFIRVTNQRIPDHVFFRECPELEVAFLTQKKSQTPSAVPVVVQLLGGDPNWIAENAVRAVELGSPGIDLNFGCPAPTVNRHDGGASLLQFPERIHGIVATVRAAIPKEFPVTAKIRLGFLDTELCLENALAAEAGGAAHLTVHCRTKKQMYQPPADWTWIPRLKNHLKIPVIANGEIWNRQDFESCFAITDCEAVMVGRGALSDPWLGRRIQNTDQLNHAETEWSRCLALLQSLREHCERQSPAYTCARLKQMLRYLTRTHPEAQTLFQKIKTLKSTPEITALMHESQFEPSIALTTPDLGPNKSIPRPKALDPSRTNPSPKTFIRPSLH